jgi:hypothetical protein
VPAGGQPQVNVYDATTGALRFSFLAYPASFTGGVRVAVGDVNSDGVTMSILENFFAYSPGFRGGAFVG